MIKKIFYGLLCASSIYASNILLIDTDTNTDTQVLKQAKIVSQLFITKPQPYSDQEKYNYLSHAFPSLQRFKLPITLDIAAFIACLAERNDELYTKHNHLRMNLQIDNDYLRHTIKEEQTKMSQLSEQHTDLRKQQTAQDAKLSQLTNDNQRLSQDLEESQTELTRKKDQLTKIIRQVDATNRKAFHTNKTSKQQVRNLRVKLAQQRNVTEELTKKHTQQCIKSMNSQDENIRTRQELLRISEQAHELNQKRQEEAQQAKMAISLLQQQVSSSRSHVAYITNQLAADKTQTTILHENIKTLGATNTNLVKDLQKFKHPKKTISLKPSHRVQINIPHQKKPVKKPALAPSITPTGKKDCTDFCAIS